MELLGSLNGQHWWEHEGRHMYAPQFVEFVDGLCRENAAEHFDSWKRAIRLAEE